MVEEEQYKDTLGYEKYEPMVESYNIVLARLDPTPTLQNIRHFLLRMRYDKDKDAWVKVKELEPLFAKEGIEELMLQLYGRMSIDKVLSKLTESKINEIVREINEVILGFLMFNTDKYKINIGDYDNIAFMVKHNIEIFLRRALEGIENELLSKQFVYREQSTKSQTGRREDSAEQRPTGFFPSMRRFKS